MTLGNRLYELRTKRGLSQLELAEALDVSRQSVSKWETDAAVPEIDKLIAVSKYFDVPSGAWLGIEEETTDAQGNELTDTQLKMVEEIAARYVASLPKPMSKKRRLLLRLAAAATGVCLAVGLFRISSQLSELPTRYNDLANGMSSVNASVGGVTGRVEDALAQQARITADDAAELKSVDYAGNTATYALRATPKSFAEGMTAVFEAVSGDARVTTGPLAPDGLGFAAELTVPLTDEIRLYVSFGEGGSRETQLLREDRDLYRWTLPEVDIRQFSFMSVSNGQSWLNGNELTLFHWDVTPMLMENASSMTADYSYEKVSRARLLSLELGLFRGKELLAKAKLTGEAPSPEDDPDMIVMSRSLGDYTFPEITIELPPDRVLTLAARVTDEYGRAFAVALPLTVTENDGVSLATDNAFAPEDADAWNFAP